MKLHIKPSEKRIYLYAVKSYRNHDGKFGAKTVEKFGTVYLALTEIEKKNVDKELCFAYFERYFGLFFLFFRQIARYFSSSREKPSYQSSISQEIHD